MEMLVKWSVTLTDRLGPEILTVLEIKAQVLHRVRLHVKVPGWLLNLNALLTKKLPMFLSRLNEMSGGRENICFGVISENCEVFKNDIFDCKLLWMVGNISSPGHRQFCLYGFLQYDWSSQNQNKEIWPKGAGATYTLCTEICTAAILQRDNITVKNTQKSDNNLTRNNI